ncbi:MAG TPA: pilus assembly protein TadG-related protein [Telluria sp.]|jgi:hypothetical protein
MHRLHRQHGQALIYGIFLMLAGLAALFFMFNTGQLTSEKTKLVNTADAVAYSAGIMHARALNFDSYTNRAMMANEITVAQMVSLSSWLTYVQRHIQASQVLNCRTPQWSVPAWLTLVRYTPLCVLMAWPPLPAAVAAARNAFNVAGPVAVAASEVAKAQLQLAQATMFASMLPARDRLMQQVADANYRNDGTISVDTIPLTDNWSLFDGGPFIRRYSGNDRTRFRDAELAAAYSDSFVQSRTWSDRTQLAVSCIPARGTANRTGATTLNGFDSWTANDSASLRVETLRGFIPRCRTTTTYGLGSGNQTASARSSGNWRYAGVPSFFDLSAAARAYQPSNPDAARREPKLRFAIRLTRDKTQAKTSDGRSAIKPSGRLDLSNGNEAGDVMAAVSTSEVYFDRPQARADGRTELASTFNPFWQVRLVGNSAAVVAAAVALQ